MRGRPCSRGSSRRRADSCCRSPPISRIPFVAKNDPQTAFDEEVFVPWEPGLTDGPTSSRFAIVDYNADTGALEPPAVWDEDVADVSSVSKGQALDQRPRRHVPVPPGQRVGAPAVRAGLLRGRVGARTHDSVGVRGQPADRGPACRLWRERLLRPRQQVAPVLLLRRRRQDTVYTCLSADIVNHEFGHAVLDGIRPLFNESSHPQTAAFHEFMGDLTAIL